jgi:hypothetical protein
MSELSAFKIALQSARLTSPWGLSLLALAVPLIVLYILKVRKERRVVGSTWLWKSRERDLLARDPFRKLIAERALLLQLLALLLLAIALAGPRFGEAAKPPRSLGIVIDVSASMNATEAGKTRLSQAKLSAVQALRDLPPGAQAFLIASGKTPKVLSGLDTDTKKLIKILEDLAGTDEEGDLPAAVSASAERLRSEPEPQILILSDGQTKEPIALVGVTARALQFGDQAQTPLNVAIRISEASRTIDNRIQIFALLKSHADLPFEGFLSASMSGSPGTFDKLLAGRKFVLKPHESEAVTFTIDAPLAPSIPAAPFDALLKLQVSPDDALTADSVALLQIPRSRKLPVFHVSESPESWTGKALRADSSLDLRQITPEQLKRINIDPDALIVTEGVCPESGKVFPGLDWLVFAPNAESCAGLHFAPIQASPRVTSWSEVDPRLRFLTFDDVHVREAQLAENAGARALVRSSEGALIVDAGDPARMVTLVGFDPAKSDWPLRASFVIFLRNITEAAKVHRDKLQAGSASMGEPLRVPLPQGTTEVTVTVPDGSKRTVRAADGLLAFAPPSRIGAYAFRWTTPQNGYATVPVNLVSDVESNLASVPLTLQSLGNAQEGLPETAPKRAAGARSNAWLAALGLLVIALEVTLFTRRKRTTATSERSG